MSRFLTYALATSVLFTLTSAPSAQAKVSRPDAPEIIAISSSSVKDGKVDLTIKISLPKQNGGSAILGSKVKAGGRSCAMISREKSCKIIGVSFGRNLTVEAFSKNRKGFSRASKSIGYIVGRVIVLKASGCPIKRSAFLRISREYGLSENEVSLISGKCTSKSTLAHVKEAISLRSIAKYPGLSGKISSTVNAESFTSYYVSAIEYGLEVVPGSLDKWNDPLIRSFLESGFPTNKVALGAAIRGDSRYDYTYRARAEALSLAYAFGCAFGSQPACDAKAAAQAAVTALGPLVR